jgi:hypothetical protein
MHFPHCTARVNVKGCNVIVQNRLFFLPVLAVLS